MAGSLKRRAGALAITGVVIAGVVAVNSMSASGQAANEATGPAFVPYGTLTIQLTSSAGSYFLNRPGSANDVTEPISVSQPCATIAPGSGSLLKVSPTTNADTVQIRTSAFGVNTGGTSCGSSNAAVISGAERLKIELGPTLIAAGVVAKSADVQVTRRSSGNLRYALDTGGLGAPITISQSPQKVDVDPTTPFTSITFASSSTKDNEGLSIATGTTFELLIPFGTATDCGEQVSKVGASGSIAESAVFFRGENGNIDNKGSSTCVDVGVVVEIQDASTLGGDKVFWNNSSVGVDGSPQDVAGTVTINWAPVNAANSADLDREIDYDADGPGGFTPVLWCLSFSSSTDVDGNVTFTAVQPTLPANTPGANVDGTAPWCLVSNVETLNNGTIKQTQVYFGSGDPWAR